MIKKLDVHRGWSFWLSLLAVVGVTSVGRADVDFVFDVRADFELSLLGGTTLNPGAATDFYPFEAYGQLTFSLDDSILTLPTSAPFTGLTGQLDGYDAILTNQGFSISPNLEFLGGDLTNIVWNGADITSATVSNLTSRWTLVSGQGPTQLNLFTNAGLPFNGDINFADPIGESIAGPDPFEIYWDLGGGASELVATGRNRTLTIVPEPGSLALAGIFATGLVAGGWWRRRRR